MEHNGYFSTSGRSLYGRLFFPEGPAQAAVVLVAPFGEEKKCAFRLLIRLGRALAAKGIGALMFDLSGTGESTGTHAAATWDRWLEDTAAAADLAAQEFGDVPRWILGARLGGLLAASVSNTSGSGLLLLEPTVSGDDFLRDLERRQKIKTMMLKADEQETEDAEALWERGECADFGGFLVSQQLAKSLRPMQLTALLGERQGGRAIHLIRVSGSKKWPPAWASLVDTANGSTGGSAVIVKDKPFWGQLEYYESSAIIDHVLACLSGTANEEK